MADRTGCEHVSPSNIQLEFNHPGLGDRVNNMGNAGHHHQAVQRLESPVNGWRITLSVGAAAGVFLAATVSAPDTTSVSYTGADGGSLPVDTVLASQTDNLDLLAGTTATDDPREILFPDITALGSDPLDGPTDPDFISNMHDLGLLTITTAADPEDDFIAFVIQTPIFTDILTSGADPEGDLGLGDASFGLAGATVNTFESSVFPFLDSTFTLPFPDPFADLFILLVQLGF